MVALLPFTEDKLALVQTWFRHPGVVRWLGGPEWPAREFQPGGGGGPLGEMFRGRRVLRAHSWVAVDDAGVVVAQIGGEVYDRWCRYEDGVIEAIEAGPAMGMAYVVDPGRWRQGWGVATLRAVMDAPEVADVVLFAAGIEPENVASVRCAVAAGMTADREAPDGEGIIHYIRRRKAR